MEKLFVAHMKIDELLSENSKLQAQIGPKTEKPKKKDTPQFYNTFSHFPKFNESTSSPFKNDQPLFNQKKPSLNKSLTSFSNEDKTVEAEFQKNSENIEKLKLELR